MDNYIINLQSQTDRNIRRFYINRKLKYYELNNISNYILFIDSYVGGGNRFFSDCIITNYSNYNDK